MPFITTKIGRHTVVAEIDCASSISLIDINMIDHIEQNNLMSTSRDIIHDSKTAVDVYGPPYSRYPVPITSIILKLKEKRCIHEFCSFQFRKLKSANVIRN